MIGNRIEFDFCKTDEYELAVCVLKVIASVGKFYDSCTKLERKSYLKFQLVERTQMHF